MQKQQQGFVIPPRHPPRLCSFSRQVIPTPAGLHPPVPNTTPQPWLPRCPSTACGRFGPQRLWVSAAAAGLARVGGQWRGASRHPTRRSGRRPAAWPSLRGWRMGAGTPGGPVRVWRPLGPGSLGCATARPRPAPSQGRPGPHSRSLGISCSHFRAGSASAVTYGLHKAHIHGSKPQTVTAALCLKFRAPKDYFRGVFCHRRSELAEQGVVKADNVTSVLSGIYLFFFFF